eukprot:gene6258-biopygen10383
MRRRRRRQNAECDTNEGKAVPRALTGPVAKFGWSYSPAPQSADDWLDCADFDDIDDEEGSLAAQLLAQIQ